MYKCDVINPGDFMSTARIIVCFSYLSLMKKTLLFLYRLLIVIFFFTIIGSALNIQDIHVHIEEE